MQRLRFTVSMLLTLVIAATSLASAEEAADGFTPPEGLSESWYARIDTSMGRIIARLLPDQAPQSVAHFAALAEGRVQWFDPVTGEPQKARYYDGIKVDRAFAGRSIEVGDSQGTGHGGPSRFAAIEGFGPVNFNAPGRLGMTRQYGAINVVKFFVTVSAQPRLTGNHACFGIVVSGRDVVTRLSQVKTHRNGTPLDPPSIDRIRIFSVGDPPPLPELVTFRPQRREFEARPRKDKP